LVRAARDTLIGKDAECSWDAEPEEFRWCFTRKGDETNLVLLTFDDAIATLPRGKGRVAFEATAPALEVAEAIEREARNVLENFGVEGYEKRWLMYPFPLDDLHDLQTTIENERRHLG
jgi:hypothetical protein